jgi:hypothetical protein
MSIRLDLTPGQVNALRRKVVDNSPALMQEIAGALSGALGSPGTDVSARRVEIDGVYFKIVAVVSMTEISVTCKLRKLTQPLVEEPGV